METRLPAAPSHCGYCGHPLADDAPAPQRFGERFCSEPHADEFATGVRAARVDAAARRVDLDASLVATHGTACALPSAGKRRWRDRVKRVACWGAPVLLLLAMPLIWAGGWAAASGSLLSMLALLACPVGMYFMMRSMMNMQQGPSAPDATADKEERRA